MPKHCTDWLIMLRLNCDARVKTFAENAPDDAPERVGSAVLVFILCSRRFAAHRRFIAWWLRITTRKYWAGRATGDNGSAAAAATCHHQHQHHQRPQQARQQQQEQAAAIRGSRVCGRCTRMAIRSIWNRFLFEIWWRRVAFLPL